MTDKVSLKVMYECELIKTPVINGKEYHIKYLKAYEKISFREWLSVVTGLEYELIWLGRNWCSFGYVYDHTDVCIIYMEHGKIKLDWYDGLISLPVISGHHNTATGCLESVYGFPQ